MNSEELNLEEDLLKPENIDKLSYMNNLLQKHQFSEKF